MFWRRALLLAVMAVGLSACRIDLILNLDVRADGSGVVEFVLSADSEVMDFVDVEDVDLTGIGGGGWSLDGPVVDTGGTSIVLTKEVPSATQFGEVVAQLDEGRLFRGLVLDIEVGLGTTSYDFVMAIDPTMTATDFSDPVLAQALDGEPFGERLEVLEERSGGPLDESVFVSATVEMPDGSGDGGLVSLADSTPVVLNGSTRFVDDSVAERRAAAAEARDTVDDSIRLVAVFWTIAAVVAMILLSLGWRRRRRVFREIE